MPEEPREPEELEVDLEPEEPEPWVADLDGSADDDEPSEPLPPSTEAPAPGSGATWPDTPAPDVAGTSGAGPDDDLAAAAAAAAAAAGGDAADTSRTDESRIEVEGSELSDEFDLDALEAAVAEFDLGADDGRDEDGPTGGTSSAAAGVGSLDGFDDLDALSRFDQPAPAAEPGPAPAPEEDLPGLARSSDAPPPPPPPGATPASDLPPPPTPSEAPSDDPSWPFTDDDLAAAPAGSDAARSDEDDGDEPELDLSNFTAKGGSGGARNGGKGGRRLFGR